MRRILVWFRSDLRVADNRVLWQAAQDADEIIPLVCFEDQYFLKMRCGFPKIGAFRRQFIRESVANLAQNIEKLGGRLLVKSGDTLEVMREIFHQIPFDSIYCAREFTAEERALEDRLEALGLPIQRFENYGLYDIDELPFAKEEMPPVFTAFRKKVERLSRPRPLYPTPEKISIPGELKNRAMEFPQAIFKHSPPRDSRAVMDFKGGEDAAWQRLNHYFWEGDHLKSYKETRNGMLGADYSSKFSPWLAQGCISPRSILEEINRYEREVVKNSSTYWLYFELLWRDFFRLMAWKKGAHFFRIKAREEPVPGENMEKWRCGETGQDFVDANMRELLHTGFMSNRGRQNVASYWAKELQEPWYAGAAWFESQLIDFDVCSNYGNWSYVAGVGQDPRKDRRFNLEAQAQRYDKNFQFRNLWLQNSL